MAWQLIDDLTGAVVTAGAGHRLTLDLDGQTLADWDVATTDPHELLAQLGDHLCPMKTADVDPGSLDTETERLAALFARIRDETGFVDDPVDDPAEPPLDIDTALGQAGLRMLDERASDEQRRSTPDAEDIARADQMAAECEASPTAHESTDDAPVTDPPGPDVATPAAVPAQRRATAPERVADAVAGHPTDAVVRAWAVRHGVPCSTTGALKRGVREGYLRVRGGQPDPQTRVDAASRSSNAVRASDKAAIEAPGSTPPGDPGPKPAPDPTPLAGRAPAEDTADAERVRPEQVDLARDLAIDGHTPREITGRTGVDLATARKLIFEARS